MNFAHISLTPNLSADLAPKCRVENQKRLSPPVATLDARKLQRGVVILRTFEARTKCYARVSENPSDAIFKIAAGPAINVVTASSAMLHISRRGLLCRK